MSLLGFNLMYAGRLDPFGESVLIDFYIFLRLYGLKSAPYIYNYYFLPSY